MVDVWLIFAQVVPWVEVLLHTLVDWMRTDEEEGEEGREINHHGKTITVGGRPATGRVSREAFANMTQVDKYKNSPGKIMKHDDQSSVSIKRWTKNKRLRQSGSFMPMQRKTRRPLTRQRACSFMVRNGPRENRYVSFWHCPNKGGGVFSQTHSTLLKPFHKRRSCFLFTVCHNIIYAFRDFYTMFHKVPIKIFVIQNGQMRQSKHGGNFSVAKSHRGQHWQVPTLVGIFLGALTLDYDENDANIFLTRTW